MNLKTKLRNDSYLPIGIEQQKLQKKSKKNVKLQFVVIQMNDILKIQMLHEMKEEPIVFEQEYFPETLIDGEEPFTVTFDVDSSMYVVEGPRIERMLGYTNLDSEKGFEFFQNFLKTTGILEQLEALGIQDGDTVRMYGLQFDYYK